MGLYAHTDVLFTRYIQCISNSLWIVKIGACAGVCGCVCDCAVGHLKEINYGVSLCTELLSAGRDWRTWLGCCPPLCLEGRRRRGLL